MKYVEFKNHFYKLIGEYNFIKEDKIHIFRNEEVMILFEIDKSQYDNSVCKFGIGVNPFDIMKNWDLDEPKYYDHSRIKYSFIDKYIELDDIRDEEIKKLEHLVIEFFENDFIDYTCIKGLKKLIIEGKLNVSDYILEFWNI